MCIRDRPYVAPLFPLGPIVAFVMCVIVILGQNYQAVFEGHFVEIMSAYIGLPIFLAVWLVHKFLTKDRLIPLEQVAVSGLDANHQKIVK